MRKLYLSWNSLYVQNLLPFLSWWTKVRSFSKKKTNVQLYGFSVYFHFFVEQKACAQCVSPFIFLANVWVKVKTSCQNLFLVSLRRFKRNSGPHRKVRSKKGKSCIIINHYVALLWWNLLFHDIFKDFMKCLTSGMFSPPSSKFCTIISLLILSGFLFHRNL